MTKWVEQFGFNESETDIWTKIDQNVGYGPYSDRYTLIAARAVINVLKICIAKAEAL